jgi:nucleotide-binding universal stress UspA family protein
MSTLAPVLLAVDGTEGSAGALRYAVAEARRSDRRLVIAHVAPAYVPLMPMLPMPDEDLRSIGLHILDRAREKVLSVDETVEVEVALRVGSRVHRLLELASTCSLAVLGRDLPAPLDRLLTGSVAIRLAGRSACPVVAVPSDWGLSTTSGRTDPGDIVVGLKSDAHADDLLDEAFRRADTQGSTVRVVHAWYLPDPYVDRIQERTHGAAWLASGRHLLDGLLESWVARYPQVPVAVDVVHGDPVRELCRAAIGADLLVLGRSGRRLGPLGATGRALLLAAPAPVVVVPPGHVAEAPMVLEESGELLR